MGARKRRSRSYGISPLVQIPATCLTLIATSVKQLLSETTQSLEKSQMLCLSVCTGKYPPSGLVGRMQTCKNTFDAPAVSCIIVIQ